MPAAALHYFYILKENSLILQIDVHAFEYLVSVADILMSEVSWVLCWRFAILDRYFQEPGLWWIAILSLTESFILPNTFLSWE